MAREMIIVHNLMIRGINCVHRQALRVSNEGTAQDKLDFANFAFQWSRTLHHHHDLEETVIFPRFAKEAGEPDLMTGPLAEHREFDEGLERYEAYLTEVKEGREELNGAKLLGIVDEVMPVIHRHLSNEIDTLLDLKRFEDKVDWMAIFEEVVGASASRDMKQSWYRVSSRQPLGCNQMLCHLVLSS
jgi:hemerythrin-like domain-containing protein